VGYYSLFKEHNDLLVSGNCLHLVWVSLNKVCNWGTAYMWVVTLVFRYIPIKYGRSQHSLAVTGLVVLQGRCTLSYYALTVSLTILLIAILTSGVSQLRYCLHHNYSNLLQLPQLWETPLPIVSCDAHVASHRMSHSKGSAAKQFLVIVSYMLISEPKTFVAAYCGACAWLPTAG